MVGAGFGGRERGLRVWLARHEVVEARDPHLAATVVKHDGTVDEQFDAVPRVEPLERLKRDPRPVLPVAGDGEAARGVGQLSEKQLELPERPAAIDDITREDDHVRRPGMNLLEQAFFEAADLLEVEVADLQQRKPRRVGRHAGADSVIGGRQSPRRDEEAVDRSDNRHGTGEDAHAREPFAAAEPLPRAAGSGAVNVRRG